MRGTSLCSLVLILLPLLLPAGSRRYEIQFRRNDYPVVAPPARLQAAGVSKAILRVFSDDERNGGLYFHSGIFPLVRPALSLWAGEYSPSLVPLWAWMGARKFAWLNGQALLDQQWIAGQARPIPKLDLFNPQAQELIVTLFAQLARQGVNGILIQDDLTLQSFEGFSSWGRASFSRASGMAADPQRMLARGTAQGRAWEDLKAGCVAEILGRIVAACRQTRPGVEIGLNVHYEAPLTPERARSWYAFDAAAAGASGVDLFYLMAYHRQMRAEMKLGEGGNRLYFRRMLEAAVKLWGPRLVAKLQVRDWQTSEPIPLEELRTYHDLIPAEVESVCFAAADPEDIDLISRVINGASVTSDK